MGLLVSLDLDFVMTGHALWGCFPHVYEVRRSDGSSALTTHVHWDGWSAMMRERAGLGLITHLTVHELQRPQTRPAPARSSTCARTRRCCSGWRQQP